MLPLWPPVPRASDAYVFTPRAEVEECRRILDQEEEPSWWTVAREYIERFNAEHPIDERLASLPAS